MPLSPRATTALRAPRFLMGLACTLLCAGVGLAAEEAALREASRALGSDSGSIIQLLRELSYWKVRALGVEAAARTLGVNLPVEARSSVPSSVVGVVASERIIILSAGRASGAVLGALVTIGDGPVAKIIEARESVSAALVDQSFKEDISKLEGAPVRLVVSRPESTPKQ